MSIFCENTNISWEFLCEIGLSSRMKRNESILQLFYQIQKGPTTAITVFGLVKERWE